MLPLHAGKGRTVSAALGKSTDYVKNPTKTDSGEWVSTYECDPLTVDAEFNFSKSQYAAITGRDYGERDVIAYHLRQSFKPNETDPATANRIGYELAMKLTHGHHAFIYCTHTDKNHIHSHIIFNSTQLDCTMKFRNFYKSSFVIRKISDQLCLENGLSVIEIPKPSRGSYGDWLGDEKPQTLRDKLRMLIDNSLSDGKSFDEFITTIKTAGVEVKLGKHLALKAQGQERFIRCKSLGDDYTEEAIRERLSGKRLVVPKVKMTTPVTSGHKQIATPVASENTPLSQPIPHSQNGKLLIDIQAKMQQGKGAGFEQWAKVYNLKEMAKTLIFLQENDLTDFDKLEAKAQAAKDDFNDIAIRIKAAEKRMAEITELQKHVGSYGKTLAVYREYRTGGYNKKFYAANESNIIIHKASKKYFDTLGLEKLPSIKSLQTEYATLATEKKKLYSRHRPAKDFMHEILVAKQNAEKILGYNDAPQQTKNKQSER